MRAIITLFFAILFLHLSQPLFAAESLGSVLFVKATGAADDASADLFTQALPDGEPRLLLAHQALPAGFAGRLEQATPSADGAYLLLREGIGVVIRNKVSGKSRTVLGNAFSFATETEEVTRHLVGGYWLWSRADGGAIHRLSPAGDGETIPMLSWSPNGHFLLVRVDHAGLSTLRLLDPRTGKTRDLYHARHLGLFAWAPGVASLLVTEQPDAKTTLVNLFDLNGHRWSLCRWSRSITALALSAGHAHLALADSAGISLVTLSGHAGPIVTVIPHDAQSEPPSLCFSPTGETLAVFRTRDTGEPHIFHHEELWTVNVESGKAAQLAQWAANLGGEPGQSTMRRFVGWVPGAPALLLAGHNGTTAGLSSYWQKLWRIPTTPRQPADLLFDSGPMVIDMAWWAG